MKLRSALREAFAEGKATKTRPTGVKFDGEPRPVRLIVRPAPEAMKSGLEGERLALVLFEEVEDTLTEDAPEGDALEEALEEDTSGRGGSGGASSKEDTANARVAQLEAELRQTKEELRASIAEHEASKQEMQAANEELRSMNEEYRSTAEELETSKEELQSVNEELKSVNRELEEKVGQLKKANADLENLMAATEIGTLFLGEELRIQRYTPRIGELFNIRKADEGRPVGDLTHHLSYDHLVDDAQRALEEEAPVEREAQSEGGSEEGRWFLVRHHPHRTAEGTVDGVVITFVEITRRKKAEEELRSTNESLQRRTRQVQNLTEALTSAEEEERKHLSEVLHDTLQQTLFAARMKINRLKAEVELSEKHLGQAESAMELLAEGIETVRSLSRELDPPVGRKPLRGAFEWLAEQMQESYDLTVQVKAEGSAEAQSEKAEAADQSLQSLVFRLTKELLFNVVKHAETEEAFLYLQEEGGQLRVVVEDEGEGFDPAILGEEDGGGHGLVSVRDRIEMIGGTFEVESAPGEGTRITITVPWQTNGIEEVS